MLDDSQSEALLTQEALAGRLYPGSAKVTASIPTGSRCARERSRFESAGGMDDLAYVIYTSGSTASLRR